MAATTRLRNLTFSLLTLLGVLLATTSPAAATTAPASVSAHPIVAAPSVGPDHANPETRRAITYSYDRIAVATGVAAEDGAALTRYAAGGGHHVPAKSAFRGAAGYDAKEALAISNEELARLGIRHKDITGAQQTLYRQLAASGDALTWDAVASVERQALVAAGMDGGAAASTVSGAIAALQEAGVAGPTRIPWGG